MDTSSISRPRQRLSFTKKNKEWKEQNVQYWSARCNIMPVVNNDILILYNAAAGRFDESLYTYVTNPLAMDDPKLKGYPARIRNIDIISPNLNAMWGEVSERFFNPTVIAVNSNLKSKKEELQYNLIFESLKRDFINDLIQQGKTSEEISQTPLPADLIIKQVSNLKDQEAIMGQDAIDYILRFNEVDSVRRKTFYDFMICNKMYSYRDLQNNDTIYKWISPLELKHTATPNLDYIEDAEAVKRSVRMGISEVIDFFQDIEGFNKIIIDKLEARLSTSGYDQLTPINSGIANFWMGGNKDTALGDGVLVEHVQWTSMKKMYKVSGMDIFGNPYTVHMDEDYIHGNDEECIEYWINEKWEGYRIDSDDIIGVAPLSFQRGTYDNPSKCKNSYNGRIFGNNYVVPTSIVEKLIIYQVKYNIVHYLLEKTMAKHKDEIIIFPLGIIPEKEGYDEFTTMYYADAHGFFFVDETNPTALAALQHVRVLPGNTSNYISELYKILSAIKQDAEESIGMTPNRKGQGAASEGLGVNEERIGRSRTITEEFYRQHEETIVKDLQALMDISKVAWVEGKKATYQTSDFKTEYLEIDPTVYCNTDHAVFVQNSGQAKKDLEAMKQMGVNFASQDKDISMIARIQQATNLPKLVEELEALEEKMKNQAQANIEAENELRKAEIKDKQEDRDLQYYEINENNETKKEIAIENNQTKLLVAEQGKYGNPDADNDGQLDIVEIQKLSDAREEARAANKIKLKELEDSKQERKEKVKLEDKKMKLEEKKMQNDIKIAHIGAKKKPAST